MSKNDNHKNGQRNHPMQRAADTRGKMTRGSYDVPGEGEGDEDDVDMVMLITTMMTASTAMRTMTMMTTSLMMAMGRQQR